MKKHRAIFLDRDGTLLTERGYLGDPKKIIFYSTVFKGLKALQKFGFKLIVISNQSGVARGYFSLNDLKKVNAVFKKHLARRGIRIVKIYFCPHAPDAGCSCRKPRPALALRAARECGVDLPSSYVIGDQERDVQLARRIQATGVLVLTGAGKYYRDRFKKSGGKVATNLETASRWILRRESKKICKK